MKIKIERSELIDFKNKHVDVMGDIYQYRGEYIRVINPQKVKLVKELFETGCIDELIQKGLLIETRISDLYLKDEEEFILVHRPLRNIVRSYRWTFDMIKDAGLLIIDIMEILYKYGYELNDCCIGNICYEGAHPILVDFGSIDYYNHNWRWLRIGFYENYIYPLKMMRAGCENIINAVLHETELGRLAFDNLKYIYYGISHKKITDFLEGGIRRAQLGIYRYSDKKLLCHDKNILKSLDYISDSTWRKYQDNMWEGHTRFMPHLNLLKEHVVHVCTLLEIGANQGVFGYLCAKDKLADHIVLTDYDYGAVNKMYLHLKELDSNITIVSGILDVVNINIEECRRFQSDLVVANALTHHLLLRQNISMGHLFEKFSVLATKFLLVEFMPLGLWTPEADEETPDWYNLEWFLGEMEKYFDILSYEQVEPNRIICLGKKNG